MRQTIVILFAVCFVPAPPRLGADTPGRTSEVVPPSTGSVLTSPCDFGPELEGEQGLIVVPERIAPPREVAKSPFTSYGSPRANLPRRATTNDHPSSYSREGPGDFVTETQIREENLRRMPIGLVSEIREYVKKRDVIIVNQRGNANVPGLQGDGMNWHTPGSDLDEPLSIPKASRRLADSAAEAFERWHSRGVDLAGYDILNMVADIDDLRVAFGYDTIALRGGSFGSQWSLAYMRRWPDRVDRALLFGIEPLDHAYDSPQGIWNVFEKLESKWSSRAKSSCPPKVCWEHFGRSSRGWRRRRPPFACNIRLQTLPQASP